MVGGPALARPPSSSADGGLRLQDLVAGLDGDDRLALVVQPDQTPLTDLLQNMLLAPTEATRSLWQPWQAMTLADALKSKN